MTHVIYLSFICVLVVVCGYFAKKAYDFSIIILELEEAIEESLDILDTRYKSINEILNIPVFFDSVEVRRVIKNIRDCHDAIMVVANKLTNDIAMGQLSGIKEEEDNQTPS